MVSIVQTECENDDGCVYSATFSIDEEEVRSRRSIFDDSRRVWINGKLFFSKNKHDYLNYDNRLLPVPIYEAPAIRADT